MILLAMATSAVPLISSVTNLPDFPSIEQRIQWCKTLYEAQKGRHLGMQAFCAELGIPSSLARSNQLGKLVPLHSKRLAEAVGISNSWILFGSAASTPVTSLPDLPHQRQRLDWMRTTTNWRYGRTYEWSSILPWGKGIPELDNALDPEWVRYLSELFAAPEAWILKGEGSNVSFEEILQGKVIPVSELPDLPTARKRVGWALEKREMVDQRKWTLSAVADYLDIPYLATDIGETYQYHRLSPEKAIKLGKFLGVDPRWIRYGIDAISSEMKLPNLPNFKEKLSWLGTRRETIENRKRNYYCVDRIASLTQISTHDLRIACRRNLISKDNAIKLARFFGVSLEWISPKESSPAVGTIYPFLPNIKDRLEWAKTQKETRDNTTYEWWKLTGSKKLMADIKAGKFSRLMINSVAPILGVSALWLFYGLASFRADYPELPSLSDRLHWAWQKKDFDDGELSGVNEFLIANSIPSDCYYAWMEGANMSYEMSEKLSITLGIDEAWLRTGIHSSKTKIPSEVELPDIDSCRDRLFWAKSYLERRTGHGWAWASIAAQAGMHSADISQLTCADERRRRRISTSRAEKLAPVFGVPTRWLLGSIRTKNKNMSDRIAGKVSKAVIPMPPSRSSIRDIEETISEKIPFPLDERLPEIKDSRERLVWAKVYLEHRTGHKWSWKGLADRASMNSADISQLLTMAPGRRRKISITRAEKLAPVLGVPSTWLLSGIAV